jgi:hypothetical protein
MSKIQLEKRMIKRIEKLANSAKSLETWYARLDSNQRPFAPEANALSRLSYGRIEQQFQEPFFAIANRDAAEPRRKAEFLPCDNSSSMCCRIASSFINLSQFSSSVAGVW